MSDGSMKRVLEYVKNTNGGATKANFIEDHEPIGERLWQTLKEKDYITMDDAGRIYLTHAGANALKSAWRPEPAMIKAKATLHDGRPLYVFGLSAVNLAKLREGLPIHIDLDSIGGSGEVYIMFGETEDALAAAFADLIGPDTDVRGLKQHGD